TRYGFGQPPPGVPLSAGLEMGPPCLPMSGRGPIVVLDARRYQDQIPTTQFEPIRAHAELAGASHREDEAPTADAVGADHAIVGATEEVPGDKPTRWWYL